MLSVLFKNVGQGDSILLEWEKDDHKHYGVIDCNLYEDGNPLLEEIIAKKINHFDFILLSHLHYDHYSGLSQLLTHCLANSIKVDCFLHTFTNEFTHILNLSFLSQKIQKNTVELISLLEKAFDEGIILEICEVGYRFQDINLFNSVNLSFLAPNNSDAFNLSKQRVKYQNKQSTTVPNFNNMATIIKISNDSDCIILTSDAPKNSFNRITGKIESNTLLVQVPHHGSLYNFEKDFWDQIKRVGLCPSIFSVGDVKKDRLPNKEVVDYFEKQGFYNQSTNLVYGLAEYYGSNLPSAATQAAVAIKSQYLQTFGKKRSSSIKPINPSRFTGDQFFQIKLS